jgi:hypothetical protein
MNVAHIDLQILAGRRKIVEYKPVRCPGFSITHSREAGRLDLKTGSHLCAVLSIKSHEL